MAYRDETDPLKAEEALLTRELSALQRRETEVTRALDVTRAKLRNERTLPILEDVRIASPCSANWDDMAGDARVRFCGKCAKNVYNLSEMTRDEAESLLAKTEGEMCVRLYRRTDGTVITTDCPVGVKKKRVRRVVALAASAFGAAAAVAGLSATHEPMAMGGTIAVDDRAPPTTGAVTPPTDRAGPTMGAPIPTPADSGSHGQRALPQAPPHVQHRLMGGAIQRRP